MNITQKKCRAESLLRQALGKPHARFRKGQWESIESILRAERVLVVQRTGWGKSMVYFLAAKLLREEGRGLTLLISPLLSLMRNQLEAAQRMGLCACSINSTNSEQWSAINDALLNNKVDMLLISPERLANAVFLQDILGEIANNIAFFVVDETHCISDWGHDFRPDYRRIVRVLQALPSNVPVLTTTATANHRVVKDIQAQLGENLRVQRGSLVRKSLKLQNIHMPHPAARLAWLAKTIPLLRGSGIVYTLTQRDAMRVALWLEMNHISAKAYHAGMDAVHREKLEQALLHNDVKVLVATVALGMGFDKPDLGFVIHYQRPSSVVHYYQQVGRAGRAVDEAYGILLGGQEDDCIAQYFIREAFPPQQHIRAILQILLAADGGLTLAQMQRALNVSVGQLQKTIHFLTVESPSPITKVGTRWQATAAAMAYRVNEAHMAAITAIRHAEQAQMQAYMRHTGCLMAFLQEALDDTDVTRCGQCYVCNPGDFLSAKVDRGLANRASLVLRQAYQPLLPRKKWPLPNMFMHYLFEGVFIPKKYFAEEGWALSLWRDAGWGQMVAQGKYELGRFSAELVQACVDMFTAWAPHPAPTWLTCVPSHRRPHLVPDLAVRVAAALSIPFVPCVERIRDNREQKYMENSYQQAKNLDGVFAINDMCREEPCLLLDDIVNSGWTLTVVAALLRQKGCSGVYPLVLALNSPKMN